MSRALFVSKLLKRGASTKCQLFNNNNMQRVRAVSKVFNNNNNFINNNIRRYSAPLNVSLSSALEKLDSYKFDNESAISSIINNYSLTKNQSSIVELPHHEKTIGTELEGCYVRLENGFNSSSNINNNNNQHYYGTQDTVYKALSVAYAWSKDLKLNPIVMIGDVDYKDKKFVDFGLANMLPSDSDFPDSNEDREAQLCALLINLGANKVLFNDKKLNVKKAVNEWAQRNELNGRVEASNNVNKNHFHAEF